LEAQNRKTRLEHITITLVSKLRQKQSAVAQVVRLSKPIYLYIYIFIYIRYQVPPVPQTAHRTEIIALQSVRCIARCFISDIVEIPIIKHSLMIDLRNASLGLRLFLLPDGN
jgi:hypothetical protein